MHALAHVLHAARDECPRRRAGAGQTWEAARAVRTAQESGTGCSASRRSPAPPLEHAGHHGICADTACVTDRRRTIGTAPLLRTAVRAHGARGRGGRDGRRHLVFPVFLVLLLLLVPLVLVLVLLVHPDGTLQLQRVDTLGDFRGCSFTVPPLLVWCGSLAELLDEGRPRQRAEEAWNGALGIQGRGAALDPDRAALCPQAVPLLSVHPALRARVKPELGRQRPLADKHVEAVQDQDVQALRGLMLVRSANEKLLLHGHEPHSPEVDQEVNVRRLAHNSSMRPSWQQ
mmetsp:Transcript_111694/g.296874  ORF Transcript_111694/g.296874 Transcript_111694/m.296874 type:complete len:287 (+) Transcript_111694:157-1017(+)